MLGETENMIASGSYTPSHVNEIVHFRDQYLREGRPAVNKARAEACGTENEHSGNRKNLTTSSAFGIER